MSGHSSESLLAQYAATRGFRLGQPAAFRFVPGADALLFLRSGPRDPVCDLYELDLSTGDERLVATADGLLGGDREQLSPHEAARRERMRLSSQGITSFELARDGRTALIPLSGALFVLDRESGRPRRVPAPAALAPAFDPRLSPDGARAAAVRGGDVYVTELDDGHTRRLTRSSDAVTCGLAEFAAQEEMKRLRGHWWSPDGDALVYQRTDESAVEVFRVFDPMHPERAPDERRYPRAGSANADVQLGVIAATGGDTTWIDWDRARFPYLVTVRWQPGAPLTLVVQDRAQSELAVVVANPVTGATETLHVERDDAWINIDQSVPLWLPDGSGWLWLTEREGGWQLELRDPTGALVGPLTEPDFGLRGLCGVDLSAGCVHARASTDPTCVHLWRVPLAGGAPVRVTVEPGIHAAVLAPDGRRFVHTASPLSGDDRVTVRNSDGSAIARIASAAERVPVIPALELATVRAPAPGDDRPGTVGEDRVLHTAIVRPREFDPARRYPVILQVYGGPDVNMVTAQRSRYVLSQWLADQGFAIVFADGRGTPGRGRAWERAIAGDLAGAALADQVAAVQALGARYPELDTERVGVVGWSFGGYLSAMAALRRPDVFKAAVAGAPVIDWRDYDTHYTERYLGLPDRAPAAYRVSSVLSYVRRLDCALLIVHGTVDDNVYLKHSLALSDALFRLGANHEFLPLSGFTHMVPGPVVIERLHERTAAFFRQHLGAPR